MTRVGTLQVAAEIWSDAVASDQDGKVADAPTRIIWIVAGIAGAVTFFSSFLIFALPLVAGWSWMGAGLAFIGAQYASSVLLDLHHYWKKASAFLWLGWTLARGNVSKELTEKEDVIENGPKPVPTKE